MFLVKLAVAVVVSVIVLTVFPVLTWGPIGFLPLFPLAAWLGWDVWRRRQFSRQFRREVEELTHD